MYINVPDHEFDQWVANRINAKARHCRIGKVRHKTGVPWADKPSKFILQPQPSIPGPLNDHSQPWWMQGPFCDTTGVPPIKGFGSQCVSVHS